MLVYKQIGACMCTCAVFIHTQLVNIYLYDQKKTQCTSSTKIHVFSLCLVTVNRRYVNEDSIKVTRNNLLSSSHLQQNTSQEYLASTLWALSDSPSRLRRKPVFHGGIKSVITPRRHASGPMVYYIALVCLQTETTTNVIML